MSLPAAGTPWPPVPYGTALSQQRIWDAWYVGDPERLTSVYQGGPTRISNYVGDRLGGVIPAVARFFWGRPSWSGQRRSRIHVPLPSDIATASADLLFSEPPQFVVEKADKKTAARVDAILNQGALRATLLEAGELAAALGGAYLRLVYDKEVADHVLIDTVDADAALSEWRWGQLTAVTFFTEHRESDEKHAKVYRHLERHEPGRVLHGLYRGTGDNLGQPAALAEHEMTAELADVVNADSEIPTGVKGLTAAYCPNMRPQRKWRRVSELANLGRSDFDEVEPLFDSLDETMTAWLQEVRLGRARLIVPEDFLKPLGKGQGATFDYDQDIFTPVKMFSEKPDASAISPQQFEIRFEAYKATCDHLIDQALDTAGYSPSTFGRGGEGEKTATEVVSRERKSARTRDKKSRYWALALEGFLSTWLELDALQFRSGAKGRVEVVWPDTAQPSQEELARTAGLMRQAEAASTDTLVRMLHSDWDEGDILKEVALILAESSRSVPDLGPLSGEQLALPVETAEENLGISPEGGE
jgi:A118 family predicted phage portal protein